MAEPRPPEPVALICGIIAGRTRWLDEASDLLQRHLGPIALTSDTFPFNSTDYYRPQIKAYCDVVRNQFGLSEVEVTGKLVFLAAGAVTQVV